jgi:hypothetical protein
MHHHDHAERVHHEVAGLAVLAVKDKGEELDEGFLDCVGEGRRGG